MPKPVRDEETLLSAPQVAVRVGRSLATVYQMVRRGILPPPRLLGARHAAWLESEISMALRQLPLRTGRPKKTKNTPKQGGQHK